MKSTVYILEFENLYVLKVEALTKKEDTCIYSYEKYIFFLILKSIECFHLMSLQPCWCTLNKRISIISFVWNTNMAAMPMVFLVSWDCVKMLNTIVVSHRKTYTNAYPL